jgi:hypothetical protein
VNLFISSVFCATEIVADFATWFDGCSYLTQFLKSSEKDYHFCLYASLLVFIIIILIKTIKNVTGKIKDKKILEYNEDDSSQKPFDVINI